MHRLFIACRPPVDQRGLLRSVMSGITGARWQDDDQLHLTLRFVGAVDRHQAQDVADALSRVRFSSFSIALSGLGTFDRRGHIDSLWIGVDQQDMLDRLQRKVERACIAVGLPPKDRAYLPHVTLARFGRQSSGIETFLAANAGLRSARFAIDWFGLFESHLGHGGSTYHLVERYEAEPS